MIEYLALTLYSGINQFTSYLLGFNSTPKDDLNFAQDFIQENPFISYLVLYVIIIVMCGVSVMAGLACKELYSSRISSDEQKMEKEVFRRIREESQKQKQN